MKFTIDPDAFTLGDMEDFEEVTGKTLKEALKPVPKYDDEGNREFDEKGRPLSEAAVTAKVLTALVWVAHRSNGHPDFTLAEARKVRVTELVFVDDEAEAPQDKASEGNE